jgi:glycerophosphoryl diester phosphodiesterase
LLVTAWTVDDPKEIARLCEAGVAAVVTNRPDLAVF